MENSGTDHISRLCDAIIHHILSFLDVRDAAKTIILSKRWKKIWSSSHTLDFNNKHFRKKIGGSLRSNPSRTLINFMSEAILCRETAPINVLRMSLKYNSSFYYIIKQWIQLSMKLNVQELDLDFIGNYFNDHDSMKSYYCDGDHYWDSDSDSSSSDSSSSANEFDADDNMVAVDEPVSANESELSSDTDDEYLNSRFIILPSVFTCECLRVLRLKKVQIKHEGPILFGNLTCLVLDDIHVSEKVLHNILSSCPILENLQLKKISGLKKLNFSAPKLHGLKLECCHTLKEMSIDAKELQHFKFSLSRTKVFSLNFPSLVKAEIGLCSKTGHDKQKRVARLLKLLKDFRHAEDLTLYSEIFEEMAIPKGEMRNFANVIFKVKRLEMIGKMGDDAISTILSFLKAFDNLVSLSLSIVHADQEQKDLVDYRYEEKQLRKFGKNPIFCLLLNLKELKVQGFEGSDTEIMLLKFLLQRAKVLEKVDIKTYTPSFLTHQEINMKFLEWGSLRDINIHYS